MVKDIEQDEIPEVVEGKMHNITSKAGRLAMELAAEKKRLAQELEELQGEYDDIRCYRCLSYISRSIPLRAVSILNKCNRVDLCRHAVGRQSYNDRFCNKCHCRSNVFNRKPITL